MPSPTNSSDSATWSTWPTRIVALLLGGVALWGIKWLLYGSSPTEVLERLEIVKGVVTILAPFGVAYGFYLSLRRTQAMTKQADNAAQQAETATEQAATAAKVADTAAKGQATQRFIEAIKQLGTDGAGTPEGLTVRLGGIYALEKLAEEEAERYHSTVMEVLCSFVRVNSRIPLERLATNLYEKPNAGLVSIMGVLQVDDPPTGVPHIMAMIENSPTGTDASAIPAVTEAVGARLVAPEVQAIMTVICRRNVKNRRMLKKLELEKAYLCGLNLRGANLRGADLSEANLRAVRLNGANLRGADLSEANLREARLNGARLTGATLSGATLNSANLRGADLSEARLNGADLDWADLRGADLRGADLSQANLIGADLSEAKGLIETQVEATFDGDAKTKLPKGMQHPKHWTGCRLLEHPKH